MTPQEVTQVPPDGKWGWMIVLAYALNGITTISSLHGFGLIFKDTFPRFGFNATEGAIIINMNLAFGMILGLVNGPLLRRFGYRKMGVIASLLFTVGIIATAFTRSFALIIIFYGLFASHGMCMGMSAFSYALNSYFTKKRGRAMSLGLTIVGLGPIIVPQLTTLSISYYGFQGTMLLFGAFSLHSLVGSLLLHPLKWHQKYVKIDTQSTNGEAFVNEKENKPSDEKILFQEEERSLNSTLELSNIQRKRKTTISTIDHDAEIGSIYGFDITLARQFSESMQIDSVNSQRHLNRQFRSVDTINLGSSVRIFDEKFDLMKRSNLNVSKGNNRTFQETMESDYLIEKNGTETSLSIELDNNRKSQEKSIRAVIVEKVVELFDLNLLRDPIYVNIMLGMSAAIFAEANFSQLTPFILMDMKLSNQQISTVMSIIATSDLIFRSLAAFLGEWLRQPPRIMYMISLSLLIITRTSLIFVNGFTEMMFCAVGLGIAKGIRSVYMSLVVPDYVPIDKLPNASGIQMISNGIILLIAGPILGVIRDSAGYYAPTIIVMNSVTAFTLILWSVEMIVARRRKLQRDQQQNNC